VDALKPESVLDVGCGEGFVLGGLDLKTLNSFKVGLDISKKALIYARKKNHVASVVVADARNLPFRNSSFDLVLCAEVLEHFDDPLSVLAECARTSSSSCLLSVPNKIVYRLANIMRLKNLSRCGEDAEHKSAWGKKEFVEFTSRFLKVKQVRDVVLWVLVLAEKRSSE